MGFAYIVLAILAITALAIVAGVLFRGRNQSIEDDGIEKVDCEDLAKAGCNVDYMANGRTRRVRVRAQQPMVPGTYGTLVPTGSHGTPGVPPPATPLVFNFGAGNLLIAPSPTATASTVTVAGGGRLWVGANVPGAITIAAGSHVTLPGGSSLDLPQGGSYMVW